MKEGRKEFALYFIQTGHILKDSQRTQPTVIFSTQICSEALGDEKSDQILQMKNQDPCFRSREVWGHTGLTADISYALVQDFLWLPLVKQQLYHSDELRQSFTDSTENNTQVGEEKEVRSN